MRGYLRSFILNPQENYTDIRGFLEVVRPQIHQQLTDELLDLGSIKFNLALNVKLIKNKTDGSEEVTYPIFRLKHEALLDQSDITTALDRVEPKFTESLERYTNKGSGWVVEIIAGLYLDVAN